MVFFFIVILTFFNTLGAGPFFVKARVTIDFTTNCTFCVHALGTEVVFAGRTARCATMTEILLAAATDRAAFLAKVVSADPAAIGAILAGNITTVVTGNAFPVGQGNVGAVWIVGHQYVAYDGKEIV